MLDKLILKIINYSYKRIVKNIRKGSNVTINIPIQANNIQNITVEDNVYIGPNAYFSAHGKILVKSGVIVGPRLKVYTGNHNYENDEMIPYNNITITKNVIIEENVWIGGDVIILPGVTVGEGSVIAAGSVIVKNVPKCAVMGGNPAKILKYRDKELYDKLKQEGKIYFKLKNENNLKMIYQNEENH